MTSAQERKIKQTGCDVRFDNLIRQLYATDASIYQIEPVGVAFPKNPQQASLVIRAAADAGLSVTPRGAGTSLVGNAIGEGLIVEFLRYNRRITDLDLEKCRVRVGAGVVLDQLNDFLKPHEFCFGPDVATSSRATLGGMIANNSSGARCPIYGTTADHVISLEIVMADGRVEKIGPTHGSLPAVRAKIENLIHGASAEMATRWPPGLIKRWPGYGIERFLRAPNNLTTILAGSEGTLAAIFSAELKISSLPGEKGLGLIFFASVAEAMQATVELLDLKPAAIEHIDRPLLDQTKGQLHFQTARDLLELDTKPCEAILIVEFYDDVAERLSTLESRKIGLRKKILTDPAQMNLVWLVRQFEGSLSAEHGVGIARTEYMRDQLGDALLGVLREIKCTFDPKNIFNPGKIFADDHHKIDNHLRENFTRPLELPFQPVLAFAFKDRSFIGNLEQCNGCGGCLKHSGIMCPTFMATGEEVMSTRGRANIIRAALELRVNGHDPLKSAELDAALSNCLSCKGCTPECPSNVNLALLKAEMLYARWRRDGLPARERFFSNIDLLGRIGCAMPLFANAIVDLPRVRGFMEKTLGISARRSLPHYARERFDRWFARHCRASVSDAEAFHTNALQKNRGPVILWDDTFVRYHEPHIGMAAVKVLEALGFEVALVKNRRCCGRPAFSVGNLNAAAKLGKRNISQLSTLNSQLSSAPILFLEPSCWSMFVEDYRELKIQNADNIAQRCFLYEGFVEDLLAREPDALRFSERAETIAIHPHCHAKSIMDPAFMKKLAERLPGRKATVLDTACCGMAGAFGALAEKYDLSVQVAQRLLDNIDNQPPATEVIASGTSCRHQIGDLTNIRPKHMAELLAEAIVLPS